MLGSRNHIGQHPQAVIIASEPLTEKRGDWQAVPRNHMVIVTPELRVRTMALD